MHALMELRGAAWRPSAERRATPDCPPKPAPEQVALLSATTARTRRSRSRRHTRLGRIRCFVTATKRRAAIVVRSRTARTAHVINRSYRAVLAVCVRRVCYLCHVRGVSCVPWWRGGSAAVADVVGLGSRRGGHGGAELRGRPAAARKAPAGGLWSGDPENAVSAKTRAHGSTGVRIGPPCIIRRREVLGRGRRGRVTCHR
jgi:hypothetical protein